MMQTPDRLPSGLRDPRLLGLLLAAGLTAIGGAAWAAGAPVPAEIVRHFTPEDIARGHAYMQGRYWLFAAGTALRAGFLLALVFTPASAALRGLAVRLAPAHPATAVAIFIALLVLGFELFMLPLGFYAGFIREHAFGLSTQTAGGWLLDRGKTALLSLLVSVPVGSLLVWLWRRYPGRWVLPAWILALLVTLLLVALAPVVIDPLFNTIRPAEDLALRQRILALANRAELPVEGVYITDASRRTRKGNAYFTGLGATKRIVLYDTLLAASDPAAVDLVVAHEMGHWKHAHIWQGIGLSLLGTAVLLCCGARVLAWASRGGVLGLTGPADVVGLPLFLLVVFVLNLASLPVQNAISRHFERQADQTSLELTRDPAAFIRSEVDLARSNLADLAPPALLVWALYTHPPVAERIRMAERFPSPPAPPAPTADAPRP
jgi:STE24 endopeptidase